MRGTNREVAATAEPKGLRAGFGFMANWSLRVRRLPLHGLEAAMVALLFLTLSMLNRGASPTGLPSQFEDRVIANVSAPTALAFTPDGRMLITTQPGRLRIYKNGSLLGTPALDISGKTCSDFERGMLGVTVDPSFSSNHYIYIYYTFKKFGGCPENTGSLPVNRVSRFTLGNNDLVNPATELVLVDNMPSQAGNHNAGDVEFGNDGYLYISVGDSGCQIDNSLNCAGANQDARKQNVLTGKILRITKTGGIPTSNPFRGSDSARCNVNGRTSQAKCQETFGWGFRNPFRFAVDPNSSKIYVNDVGQGTWEEIDNLQAGKDYGWNVREGFCATGSTSNCGAPPSGMTNPIYAYGHGSCNAISGGAFVPKGIWPSTYDGAYLFSDYTCGVIWRLTGSSGSYSRTEFLTDGSPVHLEFGPYGSTKALYYTSYDGTIHRVRYTGQSNRDPIADAKSDKTYGNLDLIVKFDCSGSKDPDGDPLTYDWNFGDGSTHSTSCKPSHTYTTKAVRTVTLTVRDNRGGSDTDTIKIYAGYLPPTVTITSPTASHLFRVGETINLRATAKDSDNNSISGADICWTVILHHSNHTHPFFGPECGNNDSITTKAPEDLLAATNSYLELRVTATDSHGLKKTVTQNLNPHKVNVTLNTNPSGLGLTVNSVTIYAPDTFVSWEGYDIQVSAPNQLDQSGQGWTYASWSDGGARTHVIDTPGSNSTYTATFAQTHYPGFVATADSYVVNGHPTSNYGLSTSLDVDYGPSSTAQAYLKFNVSGLSGSVSSAKIWIYASSGTAEGPSVYQTTNSWTETGITWNNKPGITSIGRNGGRNTPSHTWVSFDVTPWVTGNGTFSFVLAGKSSDALVAASRQADTQWPRLEVITSGGSGDATPPSVPPNVEATAADWNRVHIDWDPSNDNVGVVSYDVFRDGHFLTTVAWNSTALWDTGVHGEETYSYRVRARDAAGNVSGLSAPVSVTTPIRTFNYTFSPTDDARVEQAHPSSNFGSSTQLRAEGGDDPGVRSFLKFNVSGMVGDVQSATLWVYIPSTSSAGTSNGPRVHKAASSTWSEGSVTWSNKPELLTGGWDDKGALSPGTWVQFDVTPFIHANGYATIAIISSSNDLVIFNSSEASSNRPRLVVVTSMAAGASVTAPPLEPEPVDGTKPMPSPTPEPSGTATPETTATAEASATPTPAIPFADGFETGTLDAWTKVNGLTVQQQVVDVGSFAARSANNGDQINPGKPSFADKSLSSEETNLFAGLRYNVKQQDNHDVNLVTLQTKENKQVVSVFLTGDHKLAYQFAGGAQPVIVDDVKPDEWHSLQLHLAINGAGSQIEIWHDGKLLRRDPVQLGDVKIGAFEIGESRTGRTYEIFFDQVAVDRQCVGTCSLDLVTPTPGAQSSTATQEPQAPTATPTEVPTDTPTAVPTDTASPTATPVPPTNAPVPTDTPPPAPTETPEGGHAGG